MSDDGVLHCRRSEEGTPLSATLKAYDDLTTRPTNAPHSFIQIPPTLQELRNEQRRQTTLLKIKHALQCPQLE